MEHLRKRQYLGDFVLNAQKNPVCAGTLARSASRVIPWHTPMCICVDSYHFAQKDPVSEGILARSASIIVESCLNACVDAYQFAQSCPPCGPFLYLFGTLERKLQCTSVGLNKQNYKNEGAIVWVGDDKKGQQGQQVTATIKGTTG
jgi:hypothetical protein